MYVRTDSRRATRDQRRFGGKDQAAMTQICKVLLQHAEVLAPEPARRLANSFHASPTFEL
jgi:hypothetical protein